MTPDPTDPGVVVATVVEVPKPERPKLYAHLNTVPSGDGKYWIGNAFCDREALGRRSSLDEIEIIIPGKSAPGPKAEDAAIEHLQRMVDCVSLHYRCHQCADEARAIIAAIRAGGATT